MNRKHGFFKIGSLEGFKKESPVVGKDLRFYKDHIGNGKGLKGKGHFYLLSSASLIRYSPYWFFARGFANSSSFSLVI